MASSMFPGQMHMQYPRAYNDTILTITEAACADPYVIWDKGIYYMVRVSVSSQKIGREINFLLSNFNQQKNSHL